MPDIDNRISPELHFYHISECLAAGVYKSISQLAKEQNLDGHKVSLIYLSREFTPTVRVIMNEHPNIELIYLGSSNIRNKIRLGVYCFKSQGFVQNNSILHAHSSWAGMILKTISIIRRFKNLYYTPHCYAYLRTDIPLSFRKILRYLEKITNANSKCTIIACSKNEFEESRLMGATKVIYGKNYVDVVKTKFLSRNYEKPRIINVGRIASQKNPIRFAKIASSTSSIGQFIWFGDGDDALRKNLEHHGVRVSGWIDPRDLTREYATAEYFLLTSDWEASPYSLLEAMSFGLIPIVWNFPGVNEFIEHGVHGYIVSEEKQVSAIIDNLAGDLNLAERISHQARARIELEFSIEKLHSDWRSHYAIQSK
jgi:glycosyltransferase involved in cell wall biosynthesis